MLSMEILLAHNDKVLPVYYDTDGRAFIEARPKSEFKILVKNNRSKSFLFDLSINGISLSDGNQAGQRDNKLYMIKPGEMFTFTIDFFKNPLTFAMPFQNRTGVIGLLEFEELIMSPLPSKNSVWTINNKDFAKVSTSSNIIYFETKENLEKRGIIVQYLDQLPNPFPGYDSLTTMAYAAQSSTIGLNNGSTAANAFNFQIGNNSITGSYSNAFADEIYRNLGEKGEIEVANSLSKRIIKEIRKNGGL